MSVQALQRKFILISAGAILIVMGVILLLLNGYNYRKTYQNIYVTLAFIAESGGEIASTDEGPDTGVDPGGQNASQAATESAVVPHSDFSNFDMTVETPYQLRYFSMLLHEDGAVDSMNLKHIHAISEEEAASYAVILFQAPGSRGAFNHDNIIYCWNRTLNEDGSCLICVLDCTSEIESARRLIYRSCTYGVFCLLFFVLVVALLSGKALYPMIRNMETQKQFITNAGHELKTPLAIIQADNEVLEMINGETEWSRSISNQVTRMTILINNLITIARAEEQSDIELTDTDLSALAAETTETFKPVIDQNGLTLETNINENIHGRTRKESYREVINILLDNAVKYCDEHGLIRVSLASRAMGRGSVLTISNTYKEGKDTDYTRFFDRFYRKDSSHNSARGGYGIGLSMAETLVGQSKGKISVSWKNDMISFTVILP